MIKVHFDLLLNTLNIEYSENIDAAQAEKLYFDIQKLLPQNCKNFKILTDLSDLQSMEEATKPFIRKTMDYLNGRGVTEILRIIPDETKDIGFNIMSPFHYSKEVKFITLPSRESAGKDWGEKKSVIREKTVFVEMKDAWERDLVQKNLPCEQISFFNETVQERVSDLAETEILSVFVNSRVTRDLILKMPKLKVILTRSTGYDHIDIKTAKERGVAVCNVPVYGENTVAEHAFALILSLSRNLRKAYLRTMKDDFSIEGLMGFDLKGKTLGVIGTGHIGLHVIRIALGFGMNVVAFDVKQQIYLSKTLNFEYMPLEELLAHSDIISLHAPYMPATRHLINKKNIGLIKKGAVLINTARGGLIETDALAEALDMKILSGAGLDVLEEEEYLLEEKRLREGAETEEHWQRLQMVLKNHALLHRENVVYTPHLAFYSREAVQRILDTTIQNIQAFVEGHPENIIS